jgi:hypothetical protein
MGPLGRAFLVVFICVGSAQLALADDSPPPTTRPARSARVPLPEKHADEILAMRLDPDPATCALGKRYNLSSQVGRDLIGGDDALRMRAVGVL